MIGETGVGKSTFINALANYCTYDSLPDAVKDGGSFPIQSTFTVTDPQTKTQIVISSEGKLLPGTQITKVGESVTQKPNEYVFMHGHIAINLIDTPGLLDTHDAGTSAHDTDKQNVDNILKLLSQYEEIHAIFILIKANENRLKETFQYTLTEIFKRLDKSACNNVIFIFTNARSTNFKTDSAQPILQQFLNDKNLSIDLPPKKPTIYCFENDTVQYLAECKNKIPHEEEEVDDAQKSWNKSVKTTDKLLGYFSSLKPHSLAAINSIYKATSTVSMVSKLLLENIMCIFEEVSEMDKKKNEAERLKEEITSNPRNFAKGELYSLLHMTETKVVYKQLDHTNVVCESSACAKVEGDCIIYPQICCRACKVDGFIMWYCSQMTWLGVCKACRCVKSEHRFRTTETIITKKLYEPDLAVIDEIVNSNDALRQLNEGISEFENRVKQLENETEQMIETCAKLNAFAHQHALVETSSADYELLKCLENQRQTYMKAGSLNACRKASHLANIKERYQQHLARAKHYRYSVDDVPKLIEQLHRLPRKGPDIKQAMDAEENARHKVIEDVKKTKKIYEFKFGSHFSINLGLL